jgi:hypothetical protein
MWMGWIGLKEHCKDEHGWVNPQSAGRPCKRADRNRHFSKPWISVASQQFVRRGRGAQRFVVITTESDEAEPMPIIHDWEEMKQDIVRQQAQVEQEEQAQIMAHEPRELLRGISHYL